MQTSVKKAKKKPSKALDFIKIWIYFFLSQTIHKYNIFDVNLKCQLTIRQSF